MTNAAVIGGLGIVGTATRNLFGIEDYYDLKGMTLNLEELSQKKYIFVCLPTQPKDDGYDVEPIYNIIKQVDSYPDNGRIFILRSTVIPGTTDKLVSKLGVRMVYNPEFLTMSTIDDDTFNPDIVVCGSKNEDWCLELVSLYLDHVKNHPSMIITDTKEAEMIKLAINVFYATKVVFANQLYDICEGAGIKYDVVKNAMYQRKWIGRNHLSAVYNGKRGAGGNCLTKDLNAFNRHFREQFFELVQHINGSLLELNK